VVERSHRVPVAYADHRSRGVAAVGQLLRATLLKIPVVRRQMARLAALEAAVQRQADSLNRLGGAAGPDADPSAHAPAMTRPATPEAAVALVQAQRLQALEAQVFELLEEKRRLSDQVATRDREIRLLRVDHGATFEELEAAGKVGAGSPYRFEELLSVREAVSAAAAPGVPPLVFIHVPKTGGTTLNSILAKNYRYRIDSYGANFFPRYFPDEFVALVRPPAADDTRRPAFFTGHIDLANAVFRYMPVRYVAVTLLRHPVRRVMSHYRFHSRHMASPLAAQIRDDRLGVVEYFHRFREMIRLQYEIFAPQEGSVTDALRNLSDRVSLFGLQERYDEFIVLLSELLGITDIVRAPLNRTVLDAVAVGPEEEGDLAAMLASDIEFYEGAAELYNNRLQRLNLNIGARVDSFGTLRESYAHSARRFWTRRHPWTDYYA
jgi:hypothetical protein